MIQTGYDVPLALATCASLETRWDDPVCTGGVFMENVMTGFGFRSAWVSDDDPLYPCQTVDPSHRRSCYLRAAGRILGANGRDFPAAVRTCRGLASEFVTACLRGVGREAVAKANYAPEQILATCGLLGSAQGLCLYGATRTIGDGFAAEGARRGAALCRAAPEKWRDSCFRGVGITVGLLEPTPAARARACAQLAGPHARACTTAAEGEVDPGGRGSWD